jgi:hypothetical protein
VTAMVADGLMRMIWSAIKAISESPTSEADLTFATHPAASP